MKQLRLVAVAMACAVLGGCASLAGNALYTYKRTGPTSCSLVVDSGRQLPAGFVVEITDGCGVRGTVPVATQGAAIFNAEQIGALIQAGLVRLAPVPIPPLEQPK